METVENYTTPLEKVKKGVITYEEFLNEVNCREQFEKWCNEHYLKKDEGAAQCYFDHYGFEEEETVKEYIETLD